VLKKVFLLACFPYFEKIKVGLWDHCAVCLSVYHPLINFQMTEPIFMKLGVYIMATEPISTAYFTNPFHQSVCLHVYPSYHCKTRAQSSVSLHSLLGNSSVNTFPWQRIHTMIEELFGTHFLCSPCLIKEGLWVCLYMPLLLLRNNSVKTFLQ
jgi:hypothetical protein